MTINWVEITPGKYRCTFVGHMGPRSGQRPVWSATVVSDASGWRFTVRPPTGEPINGFQGKKEKAFEAAEEIMMGDRPNSRTRVATDQNDAARPYWGVCPNCSALIEGERKLPVLPGELHFLRRCICNQVLRIVGGHNGLEFYNPVTVKRRADASGLRTDGALLRDEA